MNKPDFETAFSAVANSGAGCNIGNAFDAVGHYKGNDISQFETQWGEPPVTRDFIRAIRDAGFGAVRVPVTWKGHFDDSGVIDPDWFDRINEVVDDILGHGMYCIINLHHDGGENSWIHGSRAGYEKSGELFAKLWEQIAAHFRDHGEKLLFEALNEPINEKREWLANDEDSVAGVLAFNQRFVDTVRASGGNNAQRNLIVMPYAGSGTQGRLDTFRMPRDSAAGHLILETHNYDPQGFCWHKAIGQTLRDTWGTDEDYRQTESFSAIMKAFMDKNGVPAIVGEFGSQDKNNEDMRALQAGAFTGAMKKIGVSCFWWECEKFSIFDRKECRVKFPKIVKAITQQ